jgi:predicted permease
MWNGLVQETAWALRRLLRERRFAATAVLTLGLGIGVTTSIFSLFHGVLLAPLPYPDADRLYAVGTTSPDWNGELVYAISPAAFDVLRSRENRSLTGLAAVSGASLVLREGEEAQLLSGGAVSYEFFDVLGISLAHGQAFAREHDYGGSEPVIVLSDAFWRTRFGADPTVLGRQLRFETGVRTVTGIAPPGFGYKGNPRFTGMDPAMFWIPFVWDRADGNYQFSNYLQLIGRSGPGIPRQALQAEMDAAFEPMRASYGERGIGVIPLQDFLVNATRTPLLLLAWAVALVLLIACANVANLLLARAEARRRELAVRAALGAGTARIAAIVLLEGVLIACFAGVIGVMAAWGGTRVLVTMFAPIIPRASDASLTLPVLAFGVLLSIAAGLLAAAIAAFRARPSRLGAALQAGGRTVAGGNRRVRQVLVITETALAFVLLAGAGLLVRSFWHMQNVDLGFDTANRLAVRLVVPAARYDTPEKTSRFYHDLTEAIAGLPGVLAAGGSDLAPLQGSNANRGVFIPAAAGDTLRAVEMRYITPGYVNALALNVVRGRDIATTDRTAAPAVALISESLARTLYDERDAIGERIGLEGLTRDVDPGYEVVGIVDDVKEFGPHRDAPFAVYMPHAQEPRNRTAMTIVIWTRSDPTDVLPAVRAAIRTRDPALPIVFATPMSVLYANVIRERQILLFLVSAFGVAALALGGAGVYAVMAYTVAQRRREMGVRLALGAKPARVLRSICGHALALASAGIVLGVLAAFALRRTIEGFLFEVPSWDPLSFLAGAIGLAAIALGGSWLPALRAARIEPAEIMRDG